MFPAIEVFDFAALHRAALERLHDIDHTAMTGPMS